MTKALLLTVLLATTVAQVLPSCGRSVTVIGWVEAKYVRPIQDEPYILEINNVEYTVPYEFWSEVRVGDLVKFENGVWTIVKKAGT